jgi:plastocyanin
VSRRRILISIAAAGAALICAAPAGARVYEPARATAASNKTVKLFDNYYLPFRMTVDKGTTVTWKWPIEAIDVHDVKLKSAPAGVRKFHSEPASSGYRFRRTLKKAGRYKIVCTLHEEMTMTIRVRAGS